MAADVLGYMSEQFQAEEALMRLLPKQMADAHKEAHANLSEHLLEVILKNRTGPVITPPGQLHGVIHDWQDNHIENWDIPLEAVII